jgi:hypothetical protein
MNQATEASYVAESLPWNQRTVRRTASPQETLQCEPGTIVRASARSGRRLRTDEACSSRN